MHILGICNGSLDGNSEILLKAALVAAQQHDPSITTSWIHVPSMVIPPNPPPLSGQLDVSLGANKNMTASGATTNGHPHLPTRDDRRALLDALLDADAWILSTPIYSHAPAGKLKAVFDTIIGPYTDMTFATMAKEKKSAGDPRFANAHIDERLFKPRVAGFLAVGGSTTPDQISLALPTLWLLVYSMHVKVVDQVVVQGCSLPGAVVARRGGEAIDRAENLGRNVVSEIGKGFEDAVYRGPKTSTSCPYCFLDKVDLFYKDNKIGCVTCGAQGVLEVTEQGIIRPQWEYPCGISSVGWAGKLRHVHDIHRSTAEEAADMKADETFDSVRQSFRDVQVLDALSPVVT